MSSFPNPHPPLWGMPYAVMSCQLLPRGVVSHRRSNPSIPRLESCHTGNSAARGSFFGWGVGCLFFDDGGKRRRWSLTYNNPVFSFKSGERRREVTCAFTSTMSGICYLCMCVFVAERTKDGLSIEVCCSGGQTGVIGSGLAFDALELLQQHVGDNLQAW